QRACMRRRVRMKSRSSLEFLLLTKGPIIRNSNCAPTSRPWRNQYHKSFTISRRWVIEEVEPCYTGRLARWALLRVRSGLIALFSDSHTFAFSGIEIRFYARMLGSMARASKITALKQRSAGYSE